MEVKKQQKNIHLNKGKIQNKKSDCAKSVENNRFIQYFY